ncbi:hypothetical protein GCM10009654_57550 [Streptomyces hebeiensis]|uniref:Uncharacterized protein n=1 Tax=Streptomyces hebeiensis TaxID=229486 RepID=A0ABN1V3D9_9ACTN
MSITTTAYTPDSGRNTMGVVRRVLPVSPSLAPIHDLAPYGTNVATLGRRVGHLALQWLLARAYEVGPVVDCGYHRELSFLITVWPDVLPWDGVLTVRRATLRCPGSRQPCADAMWLLPPDSADRLTDARTLFDAVHHVRSAHPAPLAG